MVVGDALFLLMVGLVVVVLAWLAAELQKLRATIEPIATSPVVRAAAALGT